MLDCGLGVVAALALQRWLARGHQPSGKTLSNESAWLLQYGWRLRACWLAFAGFSCVLFLGVPFVVQQGLKDWRDWVVVILAVPLFGACSIGSVYLAWVVCFTKVILTNDGITKKGLIGKRTLWWFEMEKVEYCKVRLLAVVPDEQFLAIRDRFGARLSVSNQMNGFEQLDELVKRTFSRKPFNGNRGVAEAHCLPVDVCPS
jgi:hypothetical protein